MMIAPTRRLALAMLGLFPLALLPALALPGGWRAWAASLGLLGLGVLADLALLPRSLAVKAKAPATVFVGDQVELLLEITLARSTARASALLDLEGPVPPAPELPFAFPSGGAGEVRFPLQPTRRGKLRAVSAWLRMSGPCGLLERRVRQPLQVQVAVVPDLRPTRKAALRYRARRDFQVGPRVAHYVGEGSEFDALVEYGPGLDPRSIDWKATARRRRLLAREFRAERNRALLIAVDTGRLMSEPLSGIPRLDHAISAALLLGYVGLRSGDRVGLFAFDDRPRALLKPQKSAHTFRKLQQETSALAYGTGETNFTLGLLELRRRLDRRTLIVVLTDFVDSVTAELMLENLGRLASRHLVLFVALRDSLLEQQAAALPADQTALARAVVARDLIRERELVMQRLRRRGVLCLDVTPERLGTAAVDRYLAVRRRELL